MIINKLKSIISGGCLDIINESVKKVRVIRNGKITRIKRSSKNGYKIVNGVEMPMSLQEKILRKKAAIKNLRKRMHRIKTANKKHQTSMQQRENIVKNQLKNNI